MTAELYSLGLDDHDQLGYELGGGIPEASIVLLEGEYGAGKSVLSQRFSYGLCEMDYTVTFVSTELRIGPFIDQMHSLGYGSERHLLEETLLFLHADLDAKQDGDDAREPGRRNLLQRLMDASVMWNADVVVIDTFCAIIRNDPQFEALVRQNEERQAALEIIPFFRDLVSKGKTIVLTVDPSTVDDEVMGPFRAVADVHLDLEMITVGNDIRRQIAVRRFSGNGRVAGKIIGFSVRSETGIVIESRSVA